MRIRSRIKDWRRCRLLSRHGIRVEVSAPVYRAGARSGRWPVLPDRMHSQAVVYSFGVGDNVAWELAMIERFGVRVQAFDPTPECVAWVGRQDLDARFSFHRIGLAARAGVARFRRPHREGRFNYRPELPGQELPADQCIECPVQRLEEIRASLSHRRIDVLKIDIEGGEYAVLDDVIGEAPEQLLIEFHHDLPGVGFGRTRAALRQLAWAGYRIFDISRRGLEFGFVRDRDRRP